jgi:thioredoxin reductase
VVVVGSGPGGLQTSYFLKRLGIRHALLSADEQPGGMFQRFPLFQRLITWTKPHAPASHDSRAYEWFDWNSLIAEEPELRATVVRFLDGASYFPARHEMQRGLESYTTGARLEVRWGCRWESTKAIGGGFALSTSDGEYTCKVAIFAVGMTQPWKPAIPGIEEVPHYVDTKPAPAYSDRKVFVIGKRNSAFEIADALLPHAKQIILASPRPAKISVLDKTTAATRARYLQPYEDHVFGGGNLVLDVSIERVEKTGDGFRVYAKGTTKPGDFIFDADDVIAATGFLTPLLDLPELGVATFFQGGRLPAQTPFWGSPSVPGIYFAGSVTQGAVGLKKYGIPSNSSAVHGFRYNAAVLAQHIAEKHFGAAPPGDPVKAGDLTPYLLGEATHAPELWNQQSYLARVIEAEDQTGAVDRGIKPLAHFVDSGGPGALAITVETDASGDIHPAVYLRKSGTTHQHLLPSHPLNDFQTAEHRHQLNSLIETL